MTSATVTLTYNVVAPTDKPDDRRDTTKRIGERFAPHFKRIVDATDPLADKQVVRIEFVSDPDERYLLIRRVTLADIVKRYGSLYWVHKNEVVPAWKGRALPAELRDWTRLWSLWCNREFREWQMRNGGTLQALAVKDREQCPPLFIPTPKPAQRVPSRPKGPGGGPGVDTFRPTISFLRDLVRPTLYDKAIPLPAPGQSTPTPPTSDAEKGNYDLVLGRGPDDSDFINKDGRHFYVQIRDRKGLGTIAARWDTWSSSGQKTSFHKDGFGNSEIFLWEIPQDDKTSIYQSPWLLVTSSRWEFDSPEGLSRSWVRTSSGMPTNNPKNKSPISAGEPGYRLRRGLLGGTATIEYAGEKASCPIGMRDLRKLKVQLTVFRWPNERGRVDGEEWARWIIATELPDLREVYSRIGITISTDFQGPDGSTRYPPNARDGVDVVHLVDSPYVSAAGTPTVSFYDRPEFWTQLRRIVKPSAGTPRSMQVVYFRDIFDAKGKGVNGFFSPPHAICVTKRYYDWKKHGWFNNATAMAHEVGHALTARMIPNAHTASHYQQTPAHEGHYEFGHLMRHAPSCREQCTNRSHNQGNCAASGHTLNGYFYGTVYALSTIWEGVDGAGNNWYEMMRDPANGYVSRM